MIHRLLSFFTMVSGSSRPWWAGTRGLPVLGMALGLALAPLRGDAQAQASAAANAAQVAQFPDGRIVFPETAAEESKGATASNPGERTPLAFGSPKASLSWSHKPTRWGMYEVECAYRTGAGAPEAELEVEMAGQKAAGTLGATGGAQEVRKVSLGRLYLAKSDPFTLRASLKKGGGVLLDSIVLKPAPEGKPVVAEPSGEIVMASGQATTHSVLMRYEPASIKNCLGYWANPNDWADWTFPVAQPGSYEVEVWQGCGKGQGGSDVRVEVGDQKFNFVVEETGHFQNFLPRKLGRVSFAKSGDYSLAIRPQRKQAGAVMDIRQVRLIPAKSPEAANGRVKPFVDAKRVVFLGDSITYGGEYAEFVETWLRLNYPEATTEFINMGLPSETASGLSEPGHAGGSFPRPGVHERLGRILEKAKPDLIVACYGMNDGIYYPLGDERFKAFQDGITKLREKAIAAGARVVHVTPPVFDSVPLKGRTLPAGLAEYKSPFEGYNGVLDRYSEWLVAQRAQGWIVIDMHTAMNDYLAARRKETPNFALAGDGVHANSQGHWIIARSILAHFGAAEPIVSKDTPEGLLASDPRAADVLKLVQQRQRVQKDAWLTYAGHVRPGMSKGKPFPESEREAEAVGLKLRAILGPQFPGKRSVWNGFDRYDFIVDGKPVLVVAPKAAAPGKPWLWHGEFFGHKPNPDIALLGRGFHIVYMSVPDMLGSPGAVAHWNALHAELTGKHGLSPKPALIGLSRGGLYVYNWASANPDKVSCIYGDAPVCDFRSWPGAFGKGKRSDGDWRLVLECYGFKSDAEAKAYDKNPVDNLAPLAAAKIPLLHVFGDADEVVPWDENTGVVAERYQKMGGSITLIRKAGVHHHPHGLDDSTPIVDFIWKNGTTAEAKAWLEKRGETVANRK